jgi:hypothetical protein
MLVDKFVSESNHIQAMVFEMELEYKKAIDWIDDLYETLRKYCENRFGYDNVLILPLGFKRESGVSFFDINGLSVDCSEPGIYRYSKLDGDFCYNGTAIISNKRIKENKK